ncbi:uncharacterized protein LOC115475071 [Microcaecilia unicolor]|uniref:Uncharacterized protein LOC115475071 n=1 Tax=Microcaecilia unicolor TaxID=1415580 RepID=A0A6P7YTR7_9AMPH|nr:uncharacterized protein LOC115475071 [Microcaecilia unicolor]
MPQCLPKRPQLELPLVEEDFSGPLEPEDGQLSGDSMSAAPEGMEEGIVKELGDSKGQRLPEDQENYIPARASSWKWRGDEETEIQLTQTVQVKLVQSIGLGRQGTQELESSPGSRPDQNVAGSHYASEQEPSISAAMDAIQEKPCRTRGGEDTHRHCFSVHPTLLQTQILHQLDRMTRSNPGFPLLSGSFISGFGISSPATTTIVPSSAESWKAFQP